MTRPHDLILFGATGFTGELTARYLAAHAPDGCRWALAGRNLDKLAAVRDRLAADHPACADLPLLRADVDDPASLRTLAESARVVITTVGPYLRYGEPLVAACADAGTDYVDLTGESEFVDAMYLRHHERAKTTGARIVHACGFDSIPYDLGVWYTLKHLPTGVPVHVDGYLTVKAGFSGGTFASALTVLGRRAQAKATARQRRQVEGRPADRRVRLGGRLHRRPEAGGWGVPLPTLDPIVVGRSAAALPEYGPEFGYGHHLRVKRLPTVLGLGGAVAGTLALASIPPVRRWLVRRKEGTGPSPQQRSGSFFRVRFLATAGDQHVVTEVSGGDPGYDETAKMLAESALCLAYDDTPPTSGQVTTATAMGDALLARLQAAGIRFAVVEPAPAVG